VNNAYVPGYDAVGNILSINDHKMGSPQQQTFTYDDANRLTSAAANGANGAYTESYSYNSISGSLSIKAGNYYFYTTPKADFPVNGVKWVNITNTTGASTNVTVRAKGTYASGAWPTMELYIDGVFQQSWPVNTTSYADYTFSTTTAFVGAPLEWTGSTSTMVKYYYAGGTHHHAHRGGYRHKRAGIPLHRPSGLDQPHLPRLERADDPAVVRHALHALLPGVRCTILWAHY
jgi:hypothetical protein